MLVAIDCTFRINAQDPNYPTYTVVDSTVHTNANDDNFYGVLIDGTTSVTTLIVTAAKNWTQGIRVKVTINDVDVSNALVDAINIRHNKNMVSTFSLNLSDTDYAPISNSNIDLDKVVVITAYINGEEKKLFTGFVDNINVENTPFNIVINGFGYGAKLLDKRTTIVSVQDLADVAYGSKNRNNLIRYLAAQADITNLDVPEMDAVTIDNSFSDQSVWEMIQKEAMVELYWVRFNEDAVMQLRLDDIKTDITLYPTADWTYKEDRFERLNYIKSKEDIVNKIIILGKTDQKRVPVTEGYTDENFIGSKFWAEGETTSWVETIGEYDINFTVTDDELTYEKGTIRIDCNTSTSWLAIHGTGGIAMRSGHNPADPVIHGNFWRWKVASGGNVREAGVIITIGGANISTTYEVRYDQISVSVTDPNSIEKYGEKDGGSIEYPLLETEAQCEAVGGKYIQNKHRNVVNTNFRVPFNPLIIAGQTIQFRDSKIGLTTERYCIESLSHIIDPSGDSNTEVECVYYA